jgi:hypothetical protein
VTPKVLLTNLPTHTCGAGVAAEVGESVGRAEGRGVGVRVGRVSPVDWARIIGGEVAEENRSVARKTVSRVTIEMSLEG